MLGRGFQRKFTQSVMLLVSIVGLCSTALLVSEPMSQYDVEAEAQSVLASSSLPTESSLQEPLPAGRALAEAKPEKSHKRLIVIKVDCSQSGQNIITDSPRLRLYAVTCSDLGDIKSVSSIIKNETNGFVATLFHPADQLFTTDFINLNEGENTILLHMADGKQVVEKKIKITRTPASL